MAAISRDARLKALAAERGLEVTVRHFCDHRGELGPVQYVVLGGEALYDELIERGISAWLAGA